MTDDIETENIVEEIEYEEKKEPIGKIRRRTDKLCPDCEEGYLYIVEYSLEKDSITNFQVFYECFECEYKEEKKDKSNHNKEIDLDEIYR